MSEDSNRLADMPLNSAKMCAPSIAIRLKGGNIVYYTFREAVDLYASLGEALNALKRSYPEK